MSATTIKDRWMKADQQRGTHLSRAREYAALTIPEVLPPHGWTTDGQLPIPYTSAGSMGVTSLVGKMLTAIFPAGTPWNRFVLPGRIRMRAQTPQQIALVQQAEHRLFLWDMIVNSAIESANLTDRENNVQHTLRSRKREAIEALMITGDILEELTDDLELRLYRLDQYITRRDSSGNVMVHIVKDMVDPLAMDDDQRARARFGPEDLAAKPPEDRLVERYRIVEWQPVSRQWTIRHEVNDNIVHEQDEPVSPFMSTVFSLAGGADYGVGFVKRNFSDLNTLNEITARFLDIMGMAGKGLVARDRNSQTEATDLQKPSGSVIDARVEGGVVQDIATVSFANARDYQMLSAEIDRLHRRLARAFLVEDAAMPKGDRVTAAAIQRIAMELDGSTGGLYAPVASSQQIPLIKRSVHVLRKKAWLPTMPEGMVEIETITGLPAIAQEQRAQKLITFASVVQQLGPDLVARLDRRVLMDVFARSMGIYEPGLVLSEQQVAAQQNRAIQQQVALAAGEQAVATAGRIVEQQVAAGQ